MNENRIEDKYIEIPIYEYKDLLAMRERNIVTIEYINNTDYPKEEMIQILLGYYPPKEVK